MPPRATPGQDQKGLQWLEISNFSPGIYSNSSIAAAAAPNVTPGPFTAPTGSADALATWQCIALPDGGLGPLFAMVNSFPLSELGITDPPSMGYIAGWCLTQVTIEDEFVIGIEYQTGTDNEVRVWEGTIGTGVAHLLYSTAFGTPPGGGVGGMPYPFPTRVAPSSPTTTIGAQVIVIPIADSGNLLLYPNPDAPGTMGVYNFNTTGATIAFGWQNRIVTLDAVTLTWPIGATEDANNDGINYTDPPNSETYPAVTPSVIFAAEQPFGYGAVGSISAGELFMVKCRGGGLIIQGDINNPTVTFLPGVRPTGVVFGRADSNESGLFYCTQTDGCHIWTGGSTSQKISNQLDDNFFVASNIVPSRYFNYFCKRWDRYMLVSNNWLYDQQTGSWWRMLDPSVASLFAYDEAFSINQFYGAINQVTDDTTVAFFKFDKTVPASSYRWRSLPIRISENRLVDLRQVVVRASNPYGGAGNATIQAYGVDDDGNVIDFDLITINLAAMTRPQMFRINGDVKSEDLTVGVTVTAPTGQPAPVIHSLSLGYRVREQAGVV